MRYRPNWTRIILLSAVLHFILLAAISLVWSPPSIENKIEDDLQEIEWVDVDVADDSPAEVEPEISEPPPTFPDIDFPPIEIPTIPEPTVEEPPQEPPKPVENPPAKNSETQEKTSDENKAEKSNDDSTGKLKVISKVLPRDILSELISNGTISEGRALRAGKIVLAVTIGTDGKVKNVEIRRGGGNDENGNLINILSEAAAIRWIFEPFKDADGQPKEMKTQIEFKPEDF